MKNSREAMLMEEEVTQEEKVVEDEDFDPFIGELIPDDGFAFTLLSCHCSGVDTAFSQKLKEL